MELTGIMLAATFLLLASTVVVTKSATTEPVTTPTNTTTTTTTTTTTKPTNISVTPASMTPGATTPAATAASTTEKFQTYNCSLGSCTGNASCVSTILTTCPANNATSGCFLKKTNAAKTNATFEFGCTAECTNSENTDAEWCCQGNKTCVLGAMPTVPPTGKNAGSTAASFSFGVLLNTLFAAQLIRSMPLLRGV